MMGVFRSVSENAMGKSFPGDFLWVFPMGFHPHPLISYGFSPTFDIPGESIHQQLQKDLEHWNSLARQRLAASKAARQRAEADVQLLANRLRLLRQEEAKSRKIIEEVTW